MYFLKAIAKILNVNETELESKIVSPDSLVTGWYDLIIVSSPFTKPSQAEIETWYLNFQDLDSSMEIINQDKITAMTLDVQKAWANSELFVNSLTIDDLDKIKAIAFDLVIILADRSEKELIENGKLKYKKRMAFAIEVSSLMGYLNEVKALTIEQYGLQDVLLTPVFEKLNKGYTETARFMINVMEVDEVLVTSNDKSTILKELDEFLASE